MSHIITIIEHLCNNEFLLNNLFNEMQQKCDNIIHHNHIYVVVFILKEKQQIQQQNPQCKTNNKKKVKKG